MLNESKYLPVDVVKLKNGHKFTVFELAETLRRRGWIVPAYTLPANAKDIAVLCMVVKENFSRDMAEMLVKDIQWALQNLDANKI